ncbi:SHOCT domain-containing protein [Motilimonas cestriensis]|uniref:SHOCT domain-containing protein n=1 Tax=Motilimonas cestriensis TaxID=2742685 RepID=A0ABS8W608_9GAMM|nr:SHOCT domain-containing protein [Motilimonas cestriensis]MCE2594412.1 SHOCT domain-containing protein [Motilimonas cestriensis]
MGFFDLIIFVAIAGILAGVVQVIAVSNNKKKMKRQFTMVRDFKVTQEALGSDGLTGIAIDERRRKICLIKMRGEKVSRKIIGYKDLLSSEIFEDNATITKTSRSSQLGGALIGGVMLGGVGAIIGGVTGKKTSKAKTKRIDLRIVKNDTSEPIFEINFLNIESDQGSALYQQAMSQARHWHSLVSVLIRKADEQDEMLAPSDIVQDIPETPAVVTPQKQIQKPGSVADEIRKLAQLNKEGLITDDELMAQKQKLLNLN